MTKIDLGQKRCKGFTLLELMYATTLGAIVSVAVGGMVANYWKTAQGFIQEEQTMQEIYMLSTLFRNDARALLSVTDIEVSPTKVEFGTTGRSIDYDQERVIYNNGTRDFSFLEGNVVNSVIPTIINGSLIKLTLEISESDVNKTNWYNMYVMPRNE